MRLRALPCRLALCILLSPLLLSGCGGGGGYHAVSGVATSNLTNVLLALGFDGLAGAVRPRPNVAALPHVSNNAQSATITVTGAGGQVNVYTVNRANNGKYLQTANSPFKVTPGPVSLDVVFYDQPGGASGGGNTVAEYKNLAATLNAAGTLTFTDESSANLGQQTISVVAAPNTLPAVQLFLTGNLTVPELTTQSVAVEAAIPAGAPDAVFGSAQLALSAATAPPPSGAPVNSADLQYLTLSSDSVSGVTLTATATLSAQGAPLTQARPIPVTINFAGSTLQATFTVTPPVPTITSVSPSSGAVGTAVTITGTNLFNATAVNFNGVSASFTNVYYASSTLITATVPTGATSGPITVTTPGGTATSPSTFTVTP